MYSPLPFPLRKILLMYMYLYKVTQLIHETGKRAGGVTTDLLNNQLIYIYIAQRVTWTWTWSYVEKSNEQKWAYFSLSLSLSLSLAIICNGAC